MTVPKLFSTRSSLGSDLCRRLSDRPLISAADVPPSDPRLYVIGVLNPSFFFLDGKPTLVVRVDERPRDNLHATSQSASKDLSVAILGPTGALEILHVEVPNDFDPERESELPTCARAACTRGELFLSFVSHLRIATLEDDAVVVSHARAIAPSNVFTQYGCEDPRAINIEGIDCVTFNGIGRFGATGCLAIFNRDGSISSQHAILGPDHKHCALFPSRIGKSHCMLTRPLTRSSIARDGIWLLRGADLLHWGEPTPLLQARPSMWDSERIGPGPCPIRIPEGWLLLYYGVDREQSYHLGAAVLDADDPSRVISRTLVPVLSPVLGWERNGRRADTAFSCGAQLRSGDNAVRIYYGATDDSVGAADLDLSELRNVLIPVDAST